jgi:hypothetical protein
MKFIFPFALLFHDVGLGTKSFRQVPHLIGGDGIRGSECGAFGDPCLLPKGFRYLAHPLSTKPDDRRSAAK